MICTLGMTVEVTTKTLTDTADDAERKFVTTSNIVITPGCNKLQSMVTILSVALCFLFNRCAIAVTFP